MSHETEADMKTLRADFARLQGDVAQLTSTLQQLLKHGRKEGAEHAAAMLDDVEASMRDQAEMIAKQIQEKPLAAAAITFAFGMLLGLLFSSRR